MSELVHVFSYRDFILKPPQNIYFTVLKQGFNLQCTHVGGLSVLKLSRPSPASHPV